MENLELETLKNKHDAALARIKLLEEVCAELIETLEKYSDGSAYEFNRHIRGEVNFDMSVTQETAKKALASAREKIGGGE